MVEREGMKLKEMELVKLKKKGIYGEGWIIKEGERGEGGYMVN